MPCLWIRYYFFKNYVRRVLAFEKEVLETSFSSARVLLCYSGRNMTEEMIKQYLEHHFKLNPNDDFKMDPAKQDAS